ncbi:MAG: hypothetical protein HQK78_02605 [Desulfobacterales bacterium]|nr:hypothetical protein [Desulfobacterales bacterium]
MPICPKCESKRIKRSHTRTFKEKFLKNFNRRNFRCLDCGWRGIIKVKYTKEKEKLIIKRRKIFRYVTATIVTLVALFITKYLMG